MLLNIVFATIISISTASIQGNTPVNAGAAMDLTVAEATLPTQASVQLASLSLVPAPSVTTKPTDLGVFGSVAISAARLPAAAKWQDVLATDFTSYFDEDCASNALIGCDSRFARPMQGLRNQPAGVVDQDMLDMVNRTINGAITYRSDRAVWGVGDYWATPAEIAAKGAGDCEDYAIAKYWLLRSMGVPDDQLQLVLLQDTRRQLFHAVLVVHTASGAYVLDNVTNRLQRDTAYAQYQPIMSFAGGRNYIHGFEAGRTVTAMPSDLSAVAPGSGL